MYWDEFYLDGIMALGWDDIADFTAVRSLNELREVFEQTYGSEKSQAYNARMCFDFARTMGPGDVVYVKRGRRRRTAEGKSKSEIIRCLKRYVAREVFGYLCAKSVLTNTAAASP